MQAYRSDLFSDPVIENKNCCICKELKPIENFRMVSMKCRNRPNRKPRRDSICKSCRSEMCKKYRKSDAGKRTIHRIRCRRYGITEHEFLEMLEKQKGACAICKCTEQNVDVRTGKPYELAIDHCHKTGKVRALLCTFCNVGLGAFRDNPDLMHQAIKYVNQH